MPELSAIQRGRRSTIDDAIAVAPPGRGEAGMETGRRRLGNEDRNRLRLQVEVDGRTQEQLLGHRAQFGLANVRFGMEAPAIGELVIAEVGDPQVAVAVSYALCPCREEKHDTDDRGDPTGCGGMKHDQAQDRLGRR